MAPPREGLSPPRGTMDSPGLCRPHFKIKKSLGVLLGFLSPRSRSRMLASPFRGPRPWLPAGAPSRLKVPRLRAPPGPPPRANLPPSDTNLGGEILEDGGAVHCGRGTDAPMARRPVLEVPVDTADGELQRKWALLSRAVGRPSSARRHVKRHLSTNIADQPTRGGARRARALLSLSSAQDLRQKSITNLKSRPSRA